MPVHVEDILAEAGVSALYDEASAELDRRREEVVLARAGSGEPYDIAADKGWGQRVRVRGSIATSSS